MNRWRFVCRIVPGFIFWALMLLHAVGYPAEVKPVGVITGKVFDALTLEPLAGATVIYGVNRGTVTDASGRYRIQTDTGNIDVTIRFVGYQPLTRSVYVKAGDSVELNVSMWPLAREMDKVVVSAGRMEQRLSELTVSMSVIRAESIDAMHISDAQELMNRTSGVEVLDGQASIRGGSGFSYGAGSRVMVLVDGLPMLSADAGHIRWSAMPFENLSQVEVIKGASSVLYGSSALNGIVHFRTADASTAGVTKFYAESGIFGNPKRDEWVWWETPPVYASTTFSHLKRYGNTDIAAGAFFIYDNGYRKYNENHLGRMNIKIRHDCTRVKGLKYGIAAFGMYSQKQDFVLWDNAATGALIQDTSTAQRMDGTSLAIDPSVSYKPDDRSSHDLRSRMLYTNNDFPDGGNNNSRARSQYAEYQYRLKMTRIFGLSAGMMVYNSSIRSQFYGDHHAFNAAIFIQADIIPTNRLKMVAGVRLEQNSLDGVQDDIVPLFRAGVNYRVMKKTFLRASWGQGYRYPSIAEKHAATTLGSVKIIPNPLVQPESGWNAELAVKQGLLKGKYEGFIDLALFYTQNKDLIEYVFATYYDPITQTADIGFKARNIEYSRVYGFEAEFLLNTSIGGLKSYCTGGYVYIYPVEFNPFTNKNTGNFLKFRRQHALSLGGGTRWGAFDLNLQATARSKILNIDEVFLNPATRETILPGFYDYWLSHNGSYIVLDAGLGYNINRRFKVSVSLKNLTNTEYMGRPGDIQPHRHISLRLSGSL
jgi:outer membrane receptor protein involved in Fe transport